MKNTVSKESAAIVLRPAHDPLSPDNALSWTLAIAANVNQPFSSSAIATRAPVLRPAPPSRPVRTWYRGPGKRLLDIVLVIATLPVSVPVILICAIALWVEGGMPFYRQDRLGKGGGRFSILKLRTMVRDADARLAGYLQNDPVLRQEWETTQKLKCDPRITRVGTLLRATSLDELPQLWNVLKGEMSLVGPRPMLPEQLPLYGDAQAYFALQPGITGSWQVSARNENRFSFRAQVDAQYYQGLSLGGDLGVLLKTVSVVLRRTGY